MDKPEPIPLAYESPETLRPSFSSWFYCAFFVLVGFLLMLVSLREWLSTEVPDPPGGIAFGFGLLVFAFGAVQLWLNIRRIRGR